MIRTNHGSDALSEDANESDVIEFMNGLGDANSITHALENSEVIKGLQTQLKELNGVDLEKLPNSESIQTAITNALSVQEGVILNEAVNTAIANAINTAVDAKVKTLNTTISSLQTEIASLKTGKIGGDDPAPDPTPNPAPVKKGDDDNSAKINMSDMFKADVVPGLNFFNT